MTWYSPVLEGPFSRTGLDLPIASGSERKAQRYVERLNTTLDEQPERGGAPP